MPWYEISNEDQIDSPALLVYPDRIGTNIKRMIKIARNPLNLRPHVKTYKMTEIVQVQMLNGIQKFKCATIAEAEMLALCNAPDVLLAFQPVGPKINRLLNLAKSFPKTRFSTIVDNLETVNEISNIFSATKLIMPLFTDLDIGMHRTGISDDILTIGIIKKIESTSGVKFAGIHAYDGHLGNVNFNLRAAQIDKIWERINKLVDNIIAAGFQSPKIIIGGTPSFSFHAEHSNIELSPGTVLLWDHGYEKICPDLSFESAAIIFCRVISKPTNDSVCLDLGTKAIASEMPQPRAFFPGLPDVKMIMHNEEHLVLQFEGADKLAIGKCLYAIPQHICPTVALHSKVGVVEDGFVKDYWSVAARNRKLTF